MLALGPLLLRLKHPSYTSMNRKEFELEDGTLNNLASQAVVLSPSLVAPPSLPACCGPPGRSPDLTLLLRLTLPTAHPPPTHPVDLWGCESCPWAAQA